MHVLLQLLAPFAPHFGEELWERAANPKVAPHLADKPIKRIIHIKGRLINLLV
jgi:leucyl-tRNA synthetase